MPKPRHWIETLGLELTEEEVTKFLALTEYLMEQSSLELDYAEAMDDQEYQQWRKKLNLPV